MINISEHMLRFSTSWFRIIKGPHLLIIFLLLFFVKVNAQQITVKATTDTNTILIGNQFHLFLEVTHPNNLSVDWPAVADTFSLMEVIQRAAIDTIQGGAAGTVTKRQAFKLTSFDSGFHVIPPFVFEFRSPDDTTLQSQSTRPILITVNTIAIDTTRAIKDIKGQVAVPYTWQDFLPWILGLIAAILIYFLLKKYLKKRKSAPIVEKPVPTRPAHEIALEALRELEQTKLWQNGNHKAYHSELSDIIRTFIEHRWQIRAMEMTTDEILRVNLVKALPKQTFDELKYLLETSDQVKFAKMIPVVYENEQCIKNGYSFVEACKQVLSEREVAT